jgi:hypothetical protein
MAADTRTLTDKTRDVILAPAVAVVNGVQAVQTAGGAVKDFVWGDDKPGTMSCSLSNITGCIALIAYGMLRMVVFVFSLVALVFNEVILQTLNMSELLRKVSIVDIGWTAFRDIINLIFIFLVLYVAINTILGNADYGIKKMLSKIILAAIFINFSLFFTQAMIDVSNIFALTFYQKIAQTSGVSVLSQNSGISAVIADAVGIQGIYDNAINNGTTQTIGFSADMLNASTVLTYSIGSIIFVLITMFVLGAGAVMLVIRALTLIFLMILSPIAFIGGVLPQAKDAVGKWWKALISNLMFAPVYIMFIYLVIYMATKNNSRHNLQLIFTSGDSEVVIATLINMIVINGLMFASLFVAHSFGAAGSKGAISWGQAGLNKLRTVPFNNTFGRAASYVANRPALQSFAARNMVGASILGATRKIGSGFTKTVDVKEKTKKEFYESLSKEKTQYTYDNNGQVAKDKDGKPILVSPKQQHQDYLIAKGSKRSLPGVPWVDRRATRKVAAQALIDKNKEDISDKQETRNQLTEEKKNLEDQIKVLSSNGASAADIKEKEEEKKRVIEKITEANNEIKKAKADDKIKKAKAVAARGGTTRLNSDAIKV